MPPTEWAASGSGASHRNRPHACVGRHQSFRKPQPRGNRSGTVPDRPARRKQSGAARQPHLAQSRPHFGGQRRLCRRRPGQPPRRFCERPARETPYAEGRRPHRFWLPRFLPVGVHAAGRRAEPRPGADVGAGRNGRDQSFQAPIAGGSGPRAAELVVDERRAGRRGGCGAFGHRRRARLPAAGQGRSTRSERRARPARRAARTRRTWACPGR